MANNILNLIRKDFCALRSEKPMGPMFVILLVISGIFASYLSLASLVFVLLTASSYILNVFSLEEKFRTERFFASLPVRRRDIVFARYGEIFIIFGAYVIIAYPANAVSIAIGKIETRIIPLGYCAAVLLILAFMTSFTFPIYFKLGLAKAKTVTNLILGLFMAVAFAMITMRWGEGSYRAPKSISAFMNSPFPHDLPFTLLLITIAILLWGISIPTAVALYSRKEL